METLDGIVFTRRVIYRQGAIKVNACSVVALASNIACLTLDLGSKYALLADTDEGNRHDSSPQIWLGANEHTLNTVKNKRERFTIVTLPEFKGWKFFPGASVSRYTVYLTLIKPAKRPSKRGMVY